MKRKVVFSTIFALNIIVALVIIIYGNNIISTSINTDALKMYENSSVKISVNEVYSTYVAMYIIQIVLSIFSIIYILKGNILRRKGLFAILLFILALNNMDLNIYTKLFALIDIIFGFVLLMLERKNEEDFPIKRKLPYLEIMPLKKYQKVCMWILIFTYLLLMILPISKFLQGFNKNIILGIEIAIYVLLSLFVIMIFKDKLIRDFKHLFKNFYDYLVPSMKIFGIFILLYFISSYIIHFGISMPLPKNEETLGKLNIFFILFGGCIYAPIVEENIFRNSFHYIFKNKILFLVISSVLFGLLHTYEESSIFSVILQAIPYSLIGLFMAYNYTKTNNIAHTMMWHAMWNLVTTLITFFVR